MSDSFPPPPSRQGLYQNEKVSWDKANYEKPGKKKSDFVSETVHGFADSFSVHGIFYIFERDQSVICRFFWIIIVLLGVILASYWSILAYNNWEENPVLTTVTTTGLPVDKVSFPTITICGQGTIRGVLSGSLAKQAAQYLIANGIEGIPENTNFQKMTEDERLSFMDDYGEKFFTNTFPGLQDLGAIFSLVLLMTTTSPDALIRSEVAEDGGYNPCQTISRRRRRRDTTSAQNCEADFVFDTTVGYCYKTVPDEEPNICKETMGAASLLFYNDAEVTAFIELLKTGQLTIGGGRSFFLHAWRNDDNFFAFEGNYQNINTTFTTLKIVHDNEDESCLIGEYIPGDDFLSLYSTDCEEKHLTICRKWKIEEVVCPTTNSSTSTTTSTSTNTTTESTTTDENSTSWDDIKTLDYLLNPDLKDDNTRAVSLKRKAYTDMFATINMTDWYVPLFRILWYSRLPCFDVRGVTSKFAGQRGMIKSCLWKGIKVPCSAIFQTFPTDRGMCCAFNMEKAEEIFNSGNYTDLLVEMQTQDFFNSFDSQTLPEWYVKSNQPKSQPGQLKGLSLILDAHSDQLSSGSVDDDFQGFVAYIDSGDSFALTLQKGILLKAGHENLVALSATHIDAKDDIKYISPEKRGCYFSDEYKLKLYKKYTQANCMLECGIKYAHKQFGNDTCTPWFFPTQDEPIRMCNPWQAIKFNRHMLRTIPDDECYHCLPDCSGTHYDSRLSTSPFRRCDRRNLGVSRLCSMDDASLPEPRIWGKQVFEEYKRVLNDVPNYIKWQVKSSQRTYFQDTGGEVFNTMTNEYDSYEKDIAISHFYFDVSTVFQFGRQARLTWVDFLSQIGGLLGLCIGLSFISIVELVYWFVFKLGLGFLSPSRPDGRIR